MATTALALGFALMLAPPPEASGSDEVADASAPAETVAAPAPEAGADPSPKPGAGEPSPLDVAEDLFRQGVAKYETFDYPGAIELWTQAYATVPRTAGTMAVRTDLVYNLSQAHLKQYGEDDDPVHLTRAQHLLQRYIEEYEEQHPDADHDAELEDAYRRLDDVVQKREEHEATHVSEDVDTAPAKSPLVSAGIAALAGGVVGLGVMGAGMAVGNAAQADVLAADTLELEAVRITALRRGKTGNGLAIAGGIIGGALVVGGATLLGLGLTRGKSKPTATLRVLPWGTTTAGGLGCVGRF